MERRTGVLRRLLSPLLYRLSQLAPLVLLPSIVRAAPQSFSELADVLVTILNAATGTAVVLVFVFYFYGIAMDLRKRGEGEGGDPKEYLFWGVVALFVMISVAGIVALLENTIFGGSASSSAGGIDIGLSN